MADGGDFIPSNSGFMKWLNDWNMQNVGKGEAGAPTADWRSAGFSYPSEGGDQGGAGYSGGPSQGAQQAPGEQGVPGGYGIGTAQSTQGMVNAKDLQDQKDYMDQQQSRDMTSLLGEDTTGSRSTTTGFGSVPGVGPGRSAAAAQNATMGVTDESGRQGTPPGQTETTGLDYGRDINDEGSTSPAAGMSASYGRGMSTDVEPGESGARSPGRSGMNNSFGGMLGTMFGGIANAFGGRGAGGSGAGGASGNAGSGGTSGATGGEGATGDSTGGGVGGTGTGGGAFQFGGYTGDDGDDAQEPAGTVHEKEFVFTEAATNLLGADVLDQVNTIAADAKMDPEQKRQKIAQLFAGGGESEGPAEDMGEADESDDMPKGMGDRMSGMAEMIARRAA